MASKYWISIQCTYKINAIKSETKNTKQKTKKTKSKPRNNELRKRNKEF